MKKQKEINYEFSISDADDMLFWTKNSLQQYLTESTTVGKKIEKNIKSNGIINNPNNTGGRILKKYGIDAAAYTKRMSDFYHYVRPDTFTNFEIVISGKLSFKTDTQKFEVKAGETLIIPKGTSGTLRILTDNTSIFWINVNPNSHLYKYAGKDISVRTFDSVNEIISILTFYKNEIYNHCDIQILENYATTLHSLLLRELSDNGLSPLPKRVKAIIDSIRKAPHQLATSSVIAKKLAITVYELDKISVENFGKKFSKLVLEIRMKEAMRLLKEKNYSCSEISTMVGYQSQFSFSHAFKSYFNETPMSARQTSFF